MDFFAQARGFLILALVIQFSSQTCGQVETGTLRTPLVYTESRTASSLKFNAADICRPRYMTDIGQCQKKIRTCNRHGISMKWFVDNAS
jgi:hypothetical protein